MTRLIDADAFTIKKVKTKIGGKTVFAEVLQKVLDTAPTVDAVPVIRCKDCRFSEMVAPDRCYCEGFLKAWVEEDDFCAWAYPKAKK